MHDNVLIMQHIKQNLLSLKYHHEYVLRVLVVMQIDGYEMQKQMDLKHLLLHLYEQLWYLDKDERIIVVIDM
jgi:hypothetical protein